MRQREREALLHRRRPRCKFHKCISCRFIGIGILLSRFLVLRVDRLGCPSAVHLFWQSLWSLSILVCRCPAGWCAIVVHRTGRLHGSRCVCGSCDFLEDEATMSRIWPNFSFGPEATFHSGCAASEGIAYVETSPLSACVALAKASSTSDLLVDLRIGHPVAVPTWGPTAPLRRPASWIRNLLFSLTLL